MQKIYNKLLYLSCIILVALWGNQFTGCAQVDQAKTSLEDTGSYLRVRTSLMTRGIR